MIKNIFIFTFSLLITTVFSHAQTPFNNNLKQVKNSLPKEVSKELKSELQNGSAKQASDAIYLQTSKDIYETGEDLWFKGYVLNAQYFTPSSKSNILFVQLINTTTNKPVWEEKYEIENGFVNGHLFLKDTLSPGSYTLAAYSSHSFYKNKQQFNAFKKLQVVKNIQTPVQQEKIVKDSLIDFHVFPEGGHWVSGIKSRVAFKAVNKQGYPVDISGVLYENNQPVLNFKSIHNGMGSFYYTPNIDKTYYIQLNNQEKKYHLPNIQQQGITLEVFKNAKEAIFLKIAKTKDIPNQEVFIKVQVRGVLYTLAKAVLKKESLIKIPIKELPQGIAEVTLFNKDLNPVAERLVYVNLHQKLYIKSTLSKNRYHTKEKVALKIEVTDRNGNPVKAHLGMSVFDQAYHNSQLSKNIETHYELREQLKGKIYNPTYYFNDKNKYRQRDLDLLLLTQGWRSYLWNAVNLKELPKKEAIVSDFLRGNIELKRKSKKNTGIGIKMARVFSADTLKGSEFISTDSLGRFTLTPHHLKIGESAYLYVKSLTPEKPKHIIQLEDDFFKNINHIRQKLKNNELLLDQENNNNVNDFEYPLKVTKLSEVVLNTKKTKVFRDKYLGTLDSLAKTDLNTDYVCGVGGTSNHHVLNCPLHPDLTEFHTKPIEGEIYNKFNPGIVIQKRQGSVVTYSSRGIHTIVYHYPELSEAYLLEKFNLIMLKGFYGKKEFYNPVYDKEMIDDSFPDYRNTLFWKSDIITNKKGEANIEFYTSDINTKFIGVIEGVSGTGLLGTSSFQFYVNK